MRYEQEIEFWWLTSKSIWYTDVLTEEQRKAVDEWRRKKIEQIKENSMENTVKTFTDVELTEMADWAEQNERSVTHPDEKKAFGAIRQGYDWLLRFRIKQAQQKLEQIGKTDGTQREPRKQ